TACAYIVNDDRENQITIFYPGASIKDYDFKLDLNLFKDSIMIISPMNIESMIRLAKKAREAGVPYIFDPGQQIMRFDPEFMEEIVEGAWATIVNSYELKLMSSVFDIKKAQRMIITLGKNGSEVVEGDSVTKIGAVEPDMICDPTGCGDSYRAGLLYGLKRGYDLEKACRIGALSATYSIEHQGTQNHSFSMEDFAIRYKASFKEEL
ncbi:MAG: hypothetical protein ACD_65C00253G0002, partial [uncultured bacterium]